MSRVKPRSYYSNPRPGTKRAKILEFLLRKEGTTANEIMKEFNFPPTSFHTCLAYYEDMCGYDVRSFKIENPEYDPKDRKPGKRSKHKQILCYKIVGRYYWDGNYVSYLDS